MNTEKTESTQEQLTDKRVDDTPQSRVKDDLIKLHQFDLVGLEKFNPINDKSQTANIIMQQMGSTADKDFEYAKVLNSVRPDIVKNFASENTYTKMVAIENVDKHYGENLGSQSKAVEKSNTTAQPSEKGNAEKRDAEHKPIPRKLEEEKQHPYARGREEQSAGRSATKVAAHMMLGLTGGYLANKAVDYYSQKKSEAIAPVGNTSPLSEKGRVPTASQQSAPQKAGGRGR